jgi:hypothetical protein
MPVTSISRTARAEVSGATLLKRPGQLRFAYAPPSTLEIVSDGRNVAIRDKKLGTNDVYPIGQTPLKFLVQERFDLARDTQVRNLRKRQVVAGYLAGDRDGTYWGIRSHIGDYGPPENSLPCPDDKALKLAQTATRLAEMDEAFDWEGELWETIVHEIRHWAQIALAVLLQRYRLRAPLAAIELDTSGMTLRPARPVPIELARR